jgi:hypothetical protein
MRNDFNPPLDYLTCADVFFTRAWLKLCQASLTLNAQDAPTRMPVLSASDWDPQLTLRSPFIPDSNHTFKPISLECS